MRGLEVVNAPEKLQVEMDIERLNIYFLTRPLLNGAGEFAGSRTNNVPEFSFATISESEICDAVMSIRLDTAGVDTCVVHKIAFASNSTYADLYF
jgi:hypothetical protein